MQTAQASAQGPGKMATESVDPQFNDLDAWPLGQAIEAMWNGQLSAVTVVRQALPQITAATEAAATALQATGRLVYVGAGTSGRVAVQDGAELNPTFDWPSNRVCFAMAGGNKAFTSSVEGAEDNIADGIRQMDALSLTPSDVVIGVAASGTTPFTVAAINRASMLGAATIGIANNDWTPLLKGAAYPVLIPTGSEIIAGSTRMKAGTAQKVTLNLISSGIMIRLGRVYRGFMVNMHMANDKLKARGEKMVATLADCDQAKAALAISASHGDIKCATLIAMGMEPSAAVKALARANGNLRQAIAKLD
jgi:N-acetylmuramic acid 6-phosphate etherase